MKQLPLIFAFFLIACISSAIAQNSNTQQRDLKNFSAISLSIPAEVTLKKGDFSFSITADQELLDKIKTEVKSGELVIHVDNGWKNGMKETVRIEISMPSLTGLEVNGSGEIVSVSAFDGQRLSLEINGSGKIKPGELSYENLSTVINGSGHVLELKGTAGEVKFQINGSGEIDASNFSGKNVNCNVTGSGDISVSVSEALDAEITGSGDIHYSGTPSKKSVNITGSGSVSSTK